MKLRPTSYFAIRGAKVVLALAGLGMGGAVLASPQMQACSPIEVSYNGDRAMSYHLPCSAGAWDLTYTGSIPAGLGETQAHYRINVSHPSGKNFTMDRVVVIPSPAHLGHALLREAVLLDNGDIALSDCPKAGCSTYRPVGAISRMSALNPPEPEVDGAPSIAKEGQEFSIEETGFEETETLKGKSKASKGKATLVKYEIDHETKYIKPGEKILTSQGDVVYGGIESLSEATVTVTPLIQRLKADNDALSKEIAELSQQLVDKDLELLNYQHQLELTRLELKTLQDLFKYKGAGSSEKSKWFKGWGKSSSSTEGDGKHIEESLSESQAAETFPVESLSESQAVETFPVSTIPDYKETFLYPNEGSHIRIREYTENLEVSNPSLKKELDLEVEAITARGELN